MTTSNRGLFTEGDIKSHLIKKTIPMIFGMVAAIGLNLVDTMFISMLGTKELAAISFTFPVVFVTWGIAMGLSTGASAEISKAIGKGDHKNVVRYTTDSLLLSLLSVAIFIVLGLASFDFLFPLMGAKPDTMDLIWEYMMIWYPGLLFLIVPVLGNSAIRATGDMVTPTKIMMLTVVINAILDPILIFGWGPIPRMEMAGAAIATVIARSTSLIFALHILHKKKKIIDLSMPKFADMWQSWKKILVVGIPASGTNLITPIAAGIITSILARYGENAVAALGVASRIESFLFTIVIALSSVLGPFVGQNWGAAKFDRAKAGIKYSQMFSFGWGIFLYLVLALFGRYIAGIFTDTKEVLDILELFLYIVPLSYCMRGVFMISVVSLNVLNHPIIATLINAIQIFILYIPLAFLGSWLMGVKGVFYAATFASMAMAAVTMLVLNKLMKKKIKEETMEAPETVPI